MFYASVGLFVLSSVVTGSSALLGVNAAVWPVVLAMVGAAFLLYASLQLTVEVQLRYQITREEMRFLEGLGRHYSGLYLTETSEPPGTGSDLAGRDRSEPLPPARNSGA